MPDLQGDDGDDSDKSVDRSADSDDILNGIELEKLGLKEREEVEEILEYFDGRKIDKIDAKIMFEITGYQDEQFSDWDDYESDMVTGVELEEVEL